MWSSAKKKTKKKTCKLLTVCTFYCLIMTSSTVGKCRTSFKLFKGIDDTKKNLISAVQIIYSTCDAINRRIK